MNTKAIAVFVFGAISFMSLVLNAAAKDNPAQLPDTEGQPGDATKPVKVQVLAGQSGRVCMKGLKEYPQIHFEKEGQASTAADSLHLADRRGRLADRWSS